MGDADRESQQSREREYLVFYRAFLAVDLILRKVGMESQRRECREQEFSVYILECLH
jgi:hypothetical protein